ncbi:MAG: GNAT family N-acetyltransferase [Christensenellaceae bacterium]|nr:GNAT family N-acetyltransferase [Christensenellaceae bacterium]
MVHFKAITEDNFGAIIAMKRPDGEHYVSNNAYSLAQAWLYRDNGDVYPFAIYNDDEPVGFMMLDEDLDERCLYLWRIMFPPEHQGKGYGTEAIRQIIELARAAGKYDCVALDYLPGNTIAEHVYTKLGFRPTGEISNGEVVMRLDLT